MKRSLIGWGYRHVVKPILFKREPEDVHEMFVRVGGRLGRWGVARGLTSWAFSYEKKAFLSQTVDGVSFPNPVGLSAGFDKEADMVRILPKVGFGFLQIGSVTLEPYGGNPGKKAVRLKKSGGIIVNYGLMNEGIKNLCPKIPKRGACEVPVSLSIAKTNDPSTCELENGLSDYMGSIDFALEHDLGDIITINISCPNTADGEPFSSLGALERLLSATDSRKIDRPLYLKMPIDKTWEEFDAMLNVIAAHKVQGVIIGNLLKDRSSKDILDPIEEGQKGGISGKPTERVCNELIRQTYKKYGERLTIIGVGGIFSAEDAYLKIKLGASLVQLITGMIFRGPQLVGEINKGLVKLAKKDGYAHISEAIGALHR